MVSPVVTFKDYGFSLTLLNNLTAIGFDSLKDIQTIVIPHFLNGDDLVAVAQTGSGKTAAFCLPIIHKLLAVGKKRKEKSVAALILAPTRELALQIDAAIKSFIRGTHLSLSTVVGGVSKNLQIKKLAAGSDILVATPGRLLDLVRENHVDLSEVSFLILDEADRMLDMGFIPDIKRIVKHLPTTRQSALFSATMPKEIVSLAKDIVKNPIELAAARQSSVAPKIEQGLYSLPAVQKKRLLAFLLSDDKWKSIMIFVRTKYSADGLNRILTKYGFVASVMHGNKSQKARQDSLNDFRSGKSRILIATDIVARGIDIPTVDLVINYDLPDQADSYVHRIGRTGRNDRSGVAITLYDEVKEQEKLKSIEKLIENEIPKLELPKGFNANDGAGDKASGRNSSTSSKSDKSKSAKSKSDSLKAGGFHSSRPDKGSVNKDFRQKKIRKKFQGKFS